MHTCPANRALEAILRSQALVWRAELLAIALSYSVKNVRLWFVFSSNSMPSTSARAHEQRSDRGGSPVHRGMPNNRHPNLSHRSGELTSFSCDLTQQDDTHFCSAL